MLKFLHGLFSSGELIIPLEEHAFNESQSVEALTALERQWRCELPGDPPAFVAVSAVKATRILMAFCRAVIHRQVSVAQTEQFVREVCLSEDDTASQHYSVDLVLRFLPQVVERARRISIVIQSFVRALVDAVSSTRRRPFPRLTAAGP